MLNELNDWKLCEGNLSTNASKHREHVWFKNITVVRRELCIIICMKTMFVIQTHHICVKIICVVYTTILWRQYKNMYDSSITNLSECNMHDSSTGALNLWEGNLNTAQLFQENLTSSVWRHHVLLKYITAEWSEHSSLTTTTQFTNGNIKFVIYQSHIQRT